MLIHHLPRLRVRGAKLTSFRRFLLASLHMQSLKDKVSIRKVKEALAQLPRGSGSAASKIAYDETMNRIRGQEKGFCDLAIATLSWISLAKEPLTLRELQCALSVEPGDTAMDEANFVDQETLSSACAGLVVVDHESQIVRLAHYTTQEYFDSQKDVLFSDGQKLLATTCLTYLSFDAFSNWQLEESGYEWFSLPPSSLATPDQSTTTYYPLLRYAASFWHEHANSSHDPTIQGLIIDYLKRTENLAALLCPGGWYEYEEIVRELLFTWSIHGLPVAARYGFTDAVKALLHLEGYCAEDRSRIKAQALGLAAICRQSPALRILLDDNTIAPAEVSTLLKVICVQDYRYHPDNTMPPDYYEGVEILLNHGADPNIWFGDTKFIHLASSKNDVRFASLLLSHGADVELRDRNGETALHRVAHGGHSGDIVKVLLENRLDINARDNNGETALLTAVRYSSGEPKKHMSLIKQLLESGASVDQSDMYGTTALHSAASNGAVEIACQLLEAGADVNARNRNGRTALHVATIYRAVEIACRHLEAGADVKVRDFSGRTAADCLDWWDWDSTTEGKRAECEEILERYGFYQSGKKSSA